MRRLVRLLDQTEYPILLHCFRGADRTGLAAAIVLLLQTDAEFPEARKQLSPRYGHVRLGRPAALDEFLDLYADWLRERDIGHTPATIRAWIEAGYAPGEYRCKFELAKAPACVPLGKPFGVHVRAHNTGSESWHLKPGTKAGTHAGFVLTDPAGKCVANERAGLLEATVQPGESIDITLPLPALHQPGRYHLTVDMVKEYHCWFYQTGSEPLELDIEARDQMVGK